MWNQESYGCNLIFIFYFPSINIEMEEVTAKINLEIQNDSSRDTWIQGLFNEFFTKFIKTI